MLEKSVEGECVRQAQRQGGLALKIILVGRIGFPDRTVLLPGGRIAFLELKRPGKSPRKMQDWWLDELNRLGFAAAWCDTPEKVKTFFDEWLREA